MKILITCIALTTIATATQAQDLIITTTDTLKGIVNKTTLTYDEVEIFTKGNYKLVPKTLINTIKGDVTLKPYNTVQYTGTRVIDDARIYFNIIKQGTDSIKLVQFNATSYTPTIVSYVASAINNVERLQNNYKDEKTNTTQAIVSAPTNNSTISNRLDSVRRIQHKYIRFEAGISYANVIVPVVNKGEALLFTKGTKSLNGNNYELNAQLLGQFKNGISIGAGIDYFAGKVNMVGTLDVIGASSPTAGSSGQYLNFNNTAPKGFSTLGQVQASFVVKRHGFTITPQLSYELKIGKNKDALITTAGIGIGTYKDATSIYVQGGPTPIIAGVYTGALFTTFAGVKYLLNAGSFYIGPMFAYDKSNAAYTQQSVSVNGAAPVVNAINEKEPLSRVQFGLVVRF